MALDDLKSLIEEGNRTIAAIRGEVDGIKSKDVVSEQKLARMEADLAAALSAKQEAERMHKAMENRLAEIEAKANRPGKAGHDVQAEEHKAAFLDFARKGANGGAMDRLYALQEKAADVRTNTGASGGFALPKEIAADIYKVLLDISPIRSIAKVVQTGTTDYHQIVNRGGLAAEWVGETSTRTQPTATPDFADIVPTFGEMSATPEATRHSINDLFFDVEGTLVADAAERFAIAEGIAFISGDGTNKPTGFLAGTTAATGDATRAWGTIQHVPTGVAAALSANPFDQFTTLLYSLKAGYRRNATWVLNSLTFAGLASLKDSTGQYLLQPSISANDPDMIMGKPVVIAEDMASVGAGNLPVAIGDFSRAYLIADIPGIWMVRDEVTKVGWVRFPMAKRVGGRLLDSNAVKALKVATS